MNRILVVLLLPILSLAAAAVPPGSGGGQGSPSLDGSIPERTMAIRHDVADDLYLAKGALFTSVVRIGGASGSGTLIDPEWVLTAGHVAAGMVERFGLDFEIHIDGLDDPVRPAQIVIHPDFGHNRARDLALIRLDRPMVHITPSPLYEARNEEGRGITLVGFGDVKLGSGGEWVQDGQRRGATNVIDGVDADRIRFDFDAPADGATELEGVSGPGDSGGPAFINVDGIPHVAGVSSMGQSGKNGPGTYGALEYFARVSSFSGWIKAVLSQPPTQSLVGIPEGGTRRNGPEGGTPAGVEKLPEIGMMVADRNGAVQMVGRDDRLYPKALLDGGIRPPAILTSINGTVISSPAQAATVMSGISSGSTFDIVFQMAGQERRFELRMP